MFLMSKHHPHNSQRCEPVTAKLWKTLHPKQSTAKRCPCCWELVLMFDTCTAGSPLSQTLFGLPAALKRPLNFAVSHSLMCGSLTLRSLDTAWVWVPGCTKPVYNLSPPKIGLIRRLMHGGVGKEKTITPSMQMVAPFEQKWQREKVHLSRKNKKVLQTAQNTVFRPSFDRSLPEGCKGVGSWHKNGPLLSQTKSTAKAESNRCGSPRLQI